MQLGLNIVRNFKPVILGYIIVLTHVHMYNIIIDNEIVAS